MSLFTDDNFYSAYSEELKKIRVIHGILNDELTSKMLTNNPKTRLYVTETLEKELGSDWNIKCDEENNPPLLVDHNILMVRIQRKKQDGNSVIYNDLVFGEQENYLNYLVADDKLYIKPLPL